MTRRRWLVLSLVVGFCALGTGLAVPTLVRSMAEERARARNFHIEIGGVALRLGALWLSDIRLQSTHSDAIVLRLNSLRVGYGLSGVRQLSGVGGELKLRGDVKALREAVRTRLTQPVSSAGEKEPLPITVSGLQVEWINGTTSANIWGAAIQRLATGAVLSADLARLHMPWGAASFQAFELRLDRERQLSHLAAENTLVELALPAPDEANDRAPPSPPPRDAPLPNEPEPAGDAHADPKRLGPLLSFLKLDPDRGKRLQAKANVLAQLLAGRIPEGGGFSLDGVRLKLSDGAKSVSLGPARFAVSRQGQWVELAFLPGYGGGQRQHLQVELRLPLAQGATALRIDGGPVSLSDLGINDGDLGLSNTDRSRLTLRAVASLAQDAATANVSSKGEISGIELSHPALAPHPLTDIGLRWEGEGELSLDGSHLRVGSAEVRIAAVAARVTLDIQREGERMIFSGAAEVPAASCQKMFDSLPAGLAPELSGTKLGGTFSWKASVQFDTDDLKSIKPSWRMQNNCAFEQIPPEVDPARFRQVFRRTVPDETGEPMEIWTGPGSIDWVSLPAISRYMEVGVLVTEDSRFWSHNGFDQGAIESSIRQNINAGRFVRGASTISMQLSKNLYLSRTKNLARKVQEALLTMLLEQSLRKDQILELYLNVIEFAPGVFGIGRAAEYYFRSVPEDLSLAQCFFLASVLPSPSAQHFDEEGALKPGWARYLRALMRIAHRRGRLSDSELTSGLEEELRFGVPQDAGRAAPDQSGLGGEKGGAMEF